MRKIIIRLLMVTFITILLAGNVYAFGFKTELRLKIGQNYMEINNSDVKIQAAPYVSNGVTMVPLKVISDVFGAKLERNIKKKSVRISYLNTNIKFIIGKRTAVIDGVEKKILCAPEIVNNTIMVPLKVITENFNAGLSSDKATREIIVTIPVKNYEDRFRYISESKIGDSYYGWSVSYPKGCEIIDKNPAGTNLLVRNQSKGYYYYIYNIKDDNIENEQELLQELVSYVEDEKIISRKILDRNGKKWACIILEDRDEVCEYRAIIDNGRIYQIHFYTTNKDEFLNQSKYQKYKNIINSFDVGYKSNQLGIRDVSEIKKGFYTYFEKNNGWSIDLIPSMNIDMKKAENIYEIADENGMESGITCGVELYPVSKGEKLDAYVQSQVYELQTQIREEYIQQLKIQLINIGKIPTSKVSCEIKQEDATYVFYDMYLIKGQYKYDVYLFGRKDLFTEEKIKLYDKILKSFTPIF